MLKIFSLSLVITLFFSEVRAKSQYVMPMSMGMKMSIPYDIANIFIRPIAGTVGVAISVALLFILFFGVITSPFGYFFGIPSKKYVLGTSDDMMAAPRRFPEPYSAPPSMFYWLSEDELATNCHLLALCHAHSALPLLPAKVTRFYRVFSSHLVALPKEYHHAIVSGLGDLNGDLCPKKFNSCQHSSFSLVIKTLLQLLPDKVKNEHFRKRKGPMYLDL